MGDIPNPVSVQISVAGAPLLEGYNVNGEVLAPVRQVAEALGATVEWSASSGVNLIPKA